MAANFEPRAVERPYLKRWLLAASQLMLRAPLRFGAICLVLILGDHYAQDWLKGITLKNYEVDRLSMLAMPVVWALVAALSRSVDVGEFSRTFGGLLRSRVWLGALALGVFLIVCNELVKVSTDMVLWSQTPGRILHTVAFATGPAYIWFGGCFLPLLVYQPSLSVRRAYRLSDRAFSLNHVKFLGLPLDGLLIINLCVGLALSVIPEVGAVLWVVLSGVLNYIAYRDIFERRADNLPQKAALPVVNVTLVARPRATL